MGVANAEGGVGEDQEQDIVAGAGLYGSEEGLEEDDLSGNDEPCLATRTCWIRRGHPKPIATFYH